MDIGIIGLERAGKTTVFNALSGGHAATGRYGDATTHVGVARVPEARLGQLAERFRPRKVTPAEVRYWDFPGAGFTKSGPSPQFLAALAQADALLHVVRAFARADVPHPEGSVDPQRDIAAMESELVFADLSLLERRLERLGTEVRAARPGEREAGQREMALLQRAKEGLEQGVPLLRQELSAEERRALAVYPLLTAKPTLVLLNLGEEAIPQMASLEEEYRRRYARLGSQVVALCGELEMELAQLSPQEAAEFRPQMGLGERGVEVIVRLSLELLGLITLFTINEAEARAWLVPRGATALQAAGKVHSDMERGFIRAEVIDWRKLLEAGSLAEARKRGLVSTEGKGYIVQDGDVLHILFHV